GGGGRRPPRSGDRSRRRDRRPGCTAPRGPASAAAGGRGALGVQAAATGAPHRRRLRTAALDRVPYAGRGGGGGRRARVSARRRGAEPTRGARGSARAGG